ncbi:aldose 1-epimerase [Dyella psychrodurans]|uniref:Aldose epimerase n=1 Tax=Dyella psychrodurans TaxID=1927960 RepID=A0A370X7D3_9GAMM|nr:aldose epimerase [Dyella psychrodurans]RDS84333.1 aldose epimerase [Dyella psychrodurans]
MNVFSIELEQLGPHEVLVLRDVERGRCVRVARRGAALIGLEQTVGGVVRQLADGYRDSAEVESRPSSRFAIMAPFANRIADARYTFDGRSYDLQPGVEGAQRASRHGFVRGVDFDIVVKHVDAEGAHVTFATSVIRPGAFEGYPFAIDLLVTYTLDAKGLTLQASMHNVGNIAAPCFFGWHPYFRVGDGAIDTWELQIPAATLVRTDADYIPLPDAEAYQPLDRAPPELDFRHAKPIGATEINHAYADLVKDADGRARTTLRDPASGMRIHMWQESGVMLAFTADTVTRDVRRSVALEPMESMSNAFNRADCASAIRLEPGAERQFRCGVEIDPA